MTKQRKRHGGQELLDDIRNDGTAIEQKIALYNVSPFELGYTEAPSLKEFIACVKSKGLKETTGIVGMNLRIQYIPQEKGGELVVLTKPFVDGEGDATYMTIIHDSNKGLTISGYDANSYKKVAVHTRFIFQ